MAKHGKIDLVAMEISLLRIHVHDDTLERVLDSIAAAIAAAVERVNKASASGDEEYAEFLAETESPMIEALLGTAFIASQTRITAIYAGARGVYGSLEPSRQAKLPPLEEKRDVFALGATMAGSTYSEVAVINAVANYFKHNDEWDHPGDWSKLTKQSKATANTIMSIGLTSGSTANLRRAAEAFGWDASKPESIHQIAAPISAWGEKLLALVQAV